MKPTLEELRESYFIAISKLTNEEDIRNSLPLSSSDSFEELINMIISKLDDEISEWEQEALLAVTNDDKETVKKELDILNLKKRICLEKIEEFNQNNALEEAYEKTPEKHLIFTTSNLGNTLFLRDLKDIPEEYYNKVLELLNKLEDNIYEGNETKDKKLAGNKNVTDVYEKKDFKVRICYRMLSPDTCYVMLAKMKKSNNDLKDRMDIENRKLNTERDYQRVKKILQDPKSREELIMVNEQIKRELENYIKEYGRGGHHNGI